MNAKRILSIVLSILTFAAVLSGCAGNTDVSNLVYEDMKAAFEKTNLLSANIGIFSKTEKDGSVSYSECGSGVIFEKKDGEYYALTAAHVVSVENAKRLVFTVNTEMETDSIPSIEKFGEGQGVNSNGDDKKITR